MIAKNLLSYDIPAAKGSDSPENILSIMDEFQISEIPFIDEDGLFLFMISDEQLYALLDHTTELSKQNLRPEIRSYCTQYQHYMEVLKVFSERKYSCIPVLDNNKKLLGVITAKNLLHYIASSSSLNNPGAVLVLEVKSIDYTLTQIAQIIESNNAKLLSLDIRSRVNSPILEISIKLNINEINPIAQTFNRFGYDILAAYAESDYQRDMQERYQSLIKYLDL